MSHVATCDMPSYVWHALLTPPSFAPRGRYEATLTSPNLLCQQRNKETGKIRRLRPSPVGPDVRACSRT